ncbi:hypothetical protein [Rhodopirellula europaea]|uniref:Uncharacterized protein n=2 Tax=Planctomycetia TaxID=203683 RepID=A0A5C5XRF7_9PLAN|nr:hypothetical protein [Rhodopirellula europaea]EMI25302.1 hypothetical protein RESH_04127 [Rhodopirellula europaea SH398]TWT64943.1 hypothetical protein Pan14r_54450 [Crateriforma conspicua]
MTLENKVVVSAAIVVDIEPSEDGSSSRLESIVRRLQAAVDSVHSDDPGVASTGCTAYDWLNDSDTNFGRCADCRRLVSNYDKPNQIRTLIDARIVYGTLLCDECSYLRRETAAES